MAGERQGWNVWDRYKVAGLVDDTVMFTSDPIETAHALGKTRDTIGKCWPMDAAVAYTLASAGPDAQLTSKQMVNQQTKMAAAMMSQMVGYGRVPDPRVESCGHDEVDAFSIWWNQPKLDNQGHITFDNNTRLQLGDFGFSDQKWNYRTPASVAENINNAKGAWGLLLSPKFAPLRLAIEKKLGTTLWAMNTSQPFHVIHTTGLCKWKGKATKMCRHHDRPTINAWVLIKRLHPNGKINDNRYIPMWSRNRYEASVHNGWNNDMVKENLGYNIHKTIEPARIVLWDNVKRNLGNQMDEKFVIKEINAACRRMSARNFNVVTKTGLRNTATYTWKNWTWLAQLKSWIAQTSKKNRKEHDLHNGWKWTKYESRQSYGYEIAKFKWTPGKVNERYNKDSNNTVPPAIPMDIMTYYVKLGGSSWQAKNIPFRFKTKADAIQYRNFLPMMASKCGGVNYDGRKWDGDVGSELVDDSDKSLRIMHHKHTLEMDMSVDAEDMKTPTEILHALLFGTPQDYDNNIVHLSDNIAVNFTRPVVEKKVENTEKGGVETAPIT